MLSRRWTFVVSLIAWTLEAAAIGQVRGGQDSSKPMGEVEVVVLGSDGHPARNADVWFASPDRGPFGYSRVEDIPPQASAKTDAAGKAVFKWPAGVSRIEVQAKGTGYGRIGLTEVRSGKRVLASLPPLAPWATIGGQVPPELRTVHTQLWMEQEYGWEPIFFDPKKDGTFQQEVLPGSWRVRLDSIGADHRSTPGAQVPGTTALLPGQTVTVTMEKLPPPAPEVQNSTPPIKATGDRKDRKVTWVTGTVRDIAGNPVPGAKVYAFAVFYGGMRMYEKIEAATADPHGRYTIMGPGELQTFSATLIAHARGYCPTWDWLHASPAAASEEPAGMVKASVPVVDFVLTDQGGTLEVEVLHEGKPAENVAVGLWLHGVELRDIWARGSGSPERDAVEQAVSPTAKTDAHGIARFERLIPGQYQIAAGEVEPKEVEGLRRGWSGLGRPYGIAVGVGVRKGAVTRHRLAIYHQENKAHFQVFRTNGRPLVDDYAGIDFYSVGQQSGWSTGTKLDEHGIGAHEFVSSGLWLLRFQHRETRITMAPVQPPYDEAAGYVAASPLIRSTLPARFTAVSVLPAKVTIKLQDTSGKPLRGTVEIGQFFGRPEMIGSTDAQGSVQFVGLMTWKFEIRAHTAGFSPLEYGDGDTPLPDDADLGIGWAILPEPIVPQPDSDTTVVLKPQPVGYARGVLIPPRGKACSDYQVYGTCERFSEGVNRHYQPKTGAFVAVPFPPGKATLRVFQTADNAEVGRLAIMIEGAKVTKLELRPVAASPAKPAEPHQVLMGMTGVQSRGAAADVLRGNVKMADGKTPAAGAMVYFFEAGSREPNVAGIADPLGTIHSHGRWISGDSEHGARGRPVIVALLPGTCGASMVEPTPGKSLEITLPAPQSLKGKVTVNGTVPGGTPGRIRVVAGYRGKGRFDELLSVQTTADADGRFTFSGLTPGTFEVQAALDDIWLSKSNTVAVGPGASADVNLDIGTPGGATSIVLTDVGGTPLKKQTITLDRPEGPLARECWPAEWRSDGAGQIYLPTLEVGRHTFHVKADGSTHEITVPPLSATRVQDVRVKIPLAK